MARILIAGCGDLGSAVSQELVAAGHSVWAMRRHIASLPASVHKLSADLNSPASLLALPSDLDYVLYTAAAGGYSEERYRAVYSEGVHNLLAALAASSPNLRRFFLSSSTSVYGQQNGEWVDEQSATTTIGFAAHYLRGGEEQVFASPVPATIVRFSGIYAPGRTRLLENVAAGTAKCTPGVFSNRMHRDDCAGLLAHLVAMEQPERLYIGVDDAPTPLCEVLEWLAKSLSVAGPAAATKIESIRRATNKRCRNDALKRSGYRLRFPGYQDGYQALLEEFSK